MRVCLDMTRHGSPQHFHMHAYFHPRLYQRPYIHTTCAEIMLSASMSCHVMSCHLAVGRSPTTVFFCYIHQQPTSNLSPPETETEFQMTSPQCRQKNSGLPPFRKQSNRSRVSFICPSNRGGKQYYLIYFFNIFL